MIFLCQLELGFNNLYKHSIVLQFYCCVVLILSSISEKSGNLSSCSVYVCILFLDDLWLYFGDTNLFNLSSYWWPWKCVIIRGLLFLGETMKVVRYTFAVFFHFLWHVYFCFQQLRWALHADGCENNDVSFCYKDHAFAFEIWSESNYLICNIYILSFFFIGKIRFY